MNLDRRKFLQLLSLGGIGALVPSVVRCTSDETTINNIKITIKGADSKHGHMVRGEQLNQLEKITEKKDVIIVGAGVSGLAAAYHLKKNNVHNIKLIELGSVVGGNSVSGKNNYSAYPYGAHYLTLPNASNKPLQAFLYEKGIITGFDDEGKPLYKETDLCFDPEERLLIKGTFQDGLVPNYNLTEEEKKELKRFFYLMEDYKNKKGEDGKYFFEIPMSMASKDTSLDALDSITFSEFLKREKFTGEGLLWYLNYCCRDDFGGDTTKVSAWAGVNYFASHKPNPSNTDASRVLTWPQGNGKLVGLLAENLQNEIQTNCVTTAIVLENDKVLIKAIDFKNNKQFEIECKQCIVCSPPFVNNHILDKNIPYAREAAKKLTHTPWITAAITLNRLPEGRGQELCWDNVGYQTKALGYIYNQHQNLEQLQEKKVITLYIPLDDKDAVTERKLAMQRTEAEWKSMVLDELEVLHSGITAYVEEIEVWIWGHGMALPKTGLIKGNDLKELAKPIDNKLFFAHTDLSGFSIFEEGFDWGYRSAMQVVKNYETALD